MSDMLARKRADSSWHIADLPQRQWLEHLPVAIVAVGLTADRRILFSNARFAQTFGYDPQDIPTIDDWMRRAYPDHARRSQAAARWDAAVAKALEGKGRVDAGEFLITCKEGGMRAAAISMAVVDDMLISAFADTTGHARAGAGMNVDEAELRQLIDGLPMGIAMITLDARQRILFINQQMSTTFGYSLDDIPSVEDWARLAYPDPAYRAQSFARWDEAVALAIAEHGRVKSIEFRVACKNGQVRDTLINAIVMENRLLVGFVDITERRQAERALQAARDAQEKTAYEITEAIPVGTYTMVLKAGEDLARFSFMSRRFLQLTGLQREEAERDTMKAFACVHPDDLDEWIRLNAEAFATKRRFFGQTRVIVNGEVRWITAESVPRELPDGATLWEGVLIDVTTRVQAEQALQQAKDEVEAVNRALKLANEQLEHMATTDPLTGMRNRWYLEQAIRDQLERVRRYAEPVSLMLFDIDHFKSINDIHGHLAGDEALVEISHCARHALRTIDIPGRWGGDELVVMLPHTDISQAHHVAEKLRQHIASLRIATIGQVTASFGVTEFKSGDTLDLVFRRADAALYAAKTAGRNRVCVTED